MQSLRIILLCVAASVVYGILHDQVTARVCPEYFTVGHEHLIDSTDPTLLGLAWGVAATWWTGLLLGIPLALAARAGGRPRRTAGSLVLPLCLLLAVTGACALAAGLAGHRMASEGRVALPAGLASEVPAGRHAAFMADLFAHNASYAAGSVGALVLAAGVAIGRARARGMQAEEGPRPGQG